MTITYGSVCSGIEAATVAWHPLGWRAAWYAEIEPFPSAVLAHHYPNTPNHGDMTKLAAKVLAGVIPAPDALVGGTPCQAFSVAGMRQGLADPRGALTIRYVELLDAIDHVRRARGEPEAVCVWENVPGVLSDKGNAFGCFLAALVGESDELQPPGEKWRDAGCVYGPKRTVAWRILDAQYFGLAQRRRRVFVVASARRGFDPAAVLFERDGVRRDSAPRRGEGQDVAGTVTASSGGVDENDASSGRLTVFGGNNTSGAIDVAPARNACKSASGRMDFESEAFVVHGSQDPCVLQNLAHPLGRNSGQENALLAFSCKDHGADAGEMAPTLRAMNHSGSHANAGGQVAVCITGLETCATLDSRSSAGGFPGTDGACGGHLVAAFAENSRSELRYEAGDGQVTGALSTGGGKPGQGTPTAQVGSQVRRLTPRECERLQGFPDDYTKIPWRKKRAGECPDGPRYKAIGNSKAVPVVRWIGRRIEAQL